jgi:hypothetical protein
VIFSPTSSPDELTGAYSSLEKHLFYFESLINRHFFIPLFSLSEGRKEEKEGFRP